MNIAGLEYHIDGECWICDDDRAYASPHIKYQEWRIALRPDEKALYHKNNYVSLVRYVYIAVYGYTDNVVRHRGKGLKCINPDHLYASEPSTRHEGDRNTVCLNCFNLMYVENMHGKLVRCVVKAYKDGEAFLVEEALTNKGRIRLWCPFYDTEDGHGWGALRYKEMKANLLQPTLLC